MRLGEFSGYILAVLVAAIFIAAIITVILLVLYTALSMIVYVTTDIDLPEMNLFAVGSVIGIILFAWLLFNIKDNYSEAEFNNEFTIVNNIEYSDGEIRADGELFDADHITYCEHLPYDVVIEGKAYKNTWFNGIGLEKVHCRKLLIGTDTYSKLKDLMYIYVDSSKSRNSTKKVFEIIENNLKHSEFVMGNGNSQVTVVSMQDTKEKQEVQEKEFEREKEYKDEIIALKDELAEHKDEIAKLKQENKDLKKNQKSELSNDEKALKWAMRFMITLWVMCMASYVIVTYTKSRFKEK